MSYNRSKENILTKMVSTRICHDLAGPISALVNGFELIDSVGVDLELKKQSSELMRHSAQEALVQLQMLRIMYGQVHYPDQQASVADIYDIMSRFAKKYHISVLWRQVQQKQEVTIDNQQQQLLVVMLMVLCEVMAYGGVLSIEVSGKAIELIGKSDRVKEVDTVVNVLHSGSDIEAWSPHTISAVYLHYLAADMQINLELSRSGNEGEEQQVVFAARP